MQALIQEWERKLEAGSTSLVSLDDYAQGIEPPTLSSGRQERLENLLQRLSLVCEIWTRKGVELQKLSLSRAQPSNTAIHQKASPMPKALGFDSSTAESFGGHH